MYCNCGGSDAVNRVWQPPVPKLLRPYIIDTTPLRESLESQDTTSRRPRYFPDDTAFLQPLSSSIDRNTSLIPGTLARPSVADRSSRTSPARPTVLTKIEGPKFREKLEFKGVDAGADATQVCEVGTRKCRFL